MPLDQYKIRHARPETREVQYECPNCGNFTYLKPAGFRECEHCGYSGGGFERVWP